MAIHRQEPQRGAELRKECAAIANARGLRVGEVLRSPPGAHRVVVEGADLPRPAVLCVQEGAEFSDAEARRAITTEHLDTVWEVPAGVAAGRGRRPRPVCARLGEHLPGGSLRRRLEDGPLRLGEAVTVLLAVIDVLHEAHHAGFGGVGPGADRIRFRADGCPVITGFTEIGPLTAERARHDTQAFLTLVREVARAIPGADAAVLFARVDSSLAGGAAALRGALVEAAPPVAVRLSAREESRSEPAEEPRPAPPPRGRSGRSGEGRSTVRPPRQTPGSRRGREVVLDGRPLREARRAVLALVRRRPKLILVGVLPLVVAMIVFIALPPDAGADQSAGAQAEGPLTSLLSTSLPSARPPAAPPTPSVAPSATPQTAADPECAAVDVFELTGDAAPSGRDSECPPGAEDPAEAALDWLATQGGSTDPSTVHAEVAQRWGEAVLVRVEPGPKAAPDSEPASLLLVRGEAGWRIRAVYS